VVKSRELKAEGEMTVRFADVAKPLMFRFDYFRPMPQEIVSNGRTLWMYLPANRQVVVSDVRFFFDSHGSGQDSNRAENFLQGLGRISKDFLITYSAEGGDAQGNFVLELTPRRSSSMITKLHLVVNRESVIRYVAQGRRIVFDPLQPSAVFPVLASTVYDHNGNITSVEFSNIRSNVWVSDAVFNFVVPAGVEVVRPSLQP
jgi:outer membrane lipoprotein-sorting protein